MSVLALQTALASYLSGLSPREIAVAAIKKGASGRTIVRLIPPSGPSFIGIHYTLDRPDNALYEPVSELLSEGGVRIPPLLSSDGDRRLLLVEDVGKVDLLSLRPQGWLEVEQGGRSALRELHRLSCLGDPAESSLMPPFDFEAYRWEQAYFATHFVGTHLGLDASCFLQDPSLIELAAQLGAEAPDLVHRDFQSQNIMVREGLAYLIDFQGARRGWVEYDLASFLYDPYMQYTLAERRAFLTFWEEITGQAVHRPRLLSCALQRLMQAVGAFANIAHNQGDHWYFQHIEPAVRTLQELTRSSPYEELFCPLFTTYQSLSKSS